MRRTREYHPINITPKALSFRICRSISIITTEPQIKRSDERVLRRVRFFVSFFASLYLFRACYPPIDAPILAFRIVCAAQVTPRVQSQFRTTPRATQVSFFLDRGIAEVLSSISCPSSINYTNNTWPHFFLTYTANTYKSLLCL